MLFRLIVITLFAAMSAFSQAQQSAPPIEPGVSQALAQWRAADYSDVRYKLNLTLEKMSPVLKGTMEIRVKVDTAPGEQGTVPWGVPIVLDWRKIRGSEGLSTIANASVNGVNVTPLQGAEHVLDYNEPTYDNRSEHLIFLDGVKFGENVIKLDFTSPILTSGSAITRYVDKEDGAEYIYSLFVPSDASPAFPVFDQPDLKARFSLEIVAPTGWEVISNAELPSEGNALRLIKLPEKYSITNIFAETKPISTYVFAFAAGPFERVSESGAVATGFRPSISKDVEVGSETSKTTSTRDTKSPVAIAPGSDPTPNSIYVRRSQLAKLKPHAAEVFRLNREGIKYLETYFDYNFPFPKYDLVLIPEFPFGGMEHAGATFLREASIIFPTEPTKSDHISRANLIFHEAAHQWFGDTVTMRWFDDLWLKEGFAEFMAYKTIEKVMHEYNAWKVFYERNKQAPYLTDSTKGTTPIYREIANLNCAKSAYGNIVYRKALSFLKQAEFYADIEGPVNQGHEIVGADGKVESDQQYRGFRWWNQGGGSRTSNNHFTREVARPDGSKGYIGYGVDSLTVGLVAICQIKFAKATLDAVAHLYPTAEDARITCALVDAAARVRDLNFKYMSEGKGATVTARFGPDGITIVYANRISEGPAAVFEKIYDKAL